MERCPSRDLFGPFPGQSGQNIGGQCDEHEVLEAAPKIAKEFPSNKGGKSQEGAGRYPECASDEQCVPNLRMGLLGVITWGFFGGGIWVLRFRLPFA